jgi:Uma2 family endonuclease
MAPAPARRHQFILGELFFQIKQYLKGKNCNIYTAPFDVRLDATKQEDFKIRNVVQPDLSIVCDEEKLDEKGCVGAPDWIIEILSPATADRDLKTKFKVYEENGVREYWIVEPSESFVMIYTLKDGKYQSKGNFIWSDYVTPSIFPNLTIDLAEVFDIKRQKEEEK